MSTRRRYLLTVCLLMPLTAWGELTFRDAYTVRFFLLLYAGGVAVFAGRAIRRWIAALAIPSLAVALSLAGLVAVHIRADDEWFWWELGAIEIIVEVGMVTLFGTVLGLWIAENFPGKSPALAAEDAGQPT